MNRSELKEKIGEELSEAWLDGNNSLAPINKIMLLIDEYIESREDRKYSCEDCYYYIIGSTEELKYLTERRGFSDEQIMDEAKAFTFLNYKGGTNEPHQVFKHFFNYMKKRKPEQGNKADKANEWLNS